MGAEALVEVNYRWSIWRDIKFSVDNQLFTRIEPDAGQIRNFTIAKLEVPLLDAPDLDLSLSIENEYDSLPDPGDQENDLLYFFTLGLGF